MSSDDQRGTEGEETGEANDRSSILVVYPHIPHYRKAVFATLDNDVRYAVTFAADINQQDGTIPTVDPDTFSRFVRLRNVWCRNGLWQRGLLSLILRENFEHYIFLGDAHYVSTWMALLLLKMRRRKAYVWTIGWHRPDAGLKQHLRLLFYRLASGVLLYGEDGERMAVDAGLSKERLWVIGNSQGFEDAQIHEKGRSHHGNSFATIGAVVRFTAWKRLDLLLEAAALLRERGIDLRVLLVGDGPERERLEKQAARLGLICTFTGAVYEPARLREYHRQLDVTVMPEVAGLTVMQSLAFGVPVVTVDDPNRQSPEFRAVVPGVTGDLYRAGDVSSLADTIEVWLNNVASDRDAVADACRQEVRMRWSPEANAARIVEALEAGRRRSFRK